MTELVMDNGVQSLSAEQATKSGAQPQSTELVRNDGELFAFAGLWDSWKDKETDNALETYTVITTDPNELMEPIHNRMPVILHRQDYERWLEPGHPAQLQ